MCSNMINHKKIIARVSRLRKKKNLSFKFAQRSNLADGVYRPRSKFISGPGNISQVFFTTPSENCFQVLPSISADIDPPNFPCQHVSYFIFASPPPIFSRQLARRFIFVSRIVKKGEKAHEKVFGSRPANIVHSNLFPLYFPPLLSLEISSC